MKKLSFYTALNKQFICFLKATMKLFNIELVPFFQVPMERRLQTLSVLFFLFTFMHGFGLIALYYLLFLLVTPLFWIPLAYGVWYYLDYDRCEKGSRSAKWIRNLKLWKYIRIIFYFNTIFQCF